MAGRMVKEVTVRRRGLDWRRQALFVCFVMFVSSVVHAQDSKNEPQSGSQEPVVVKKESAEARKEQRDSALTLLMQGQLGPEVNLDEVFTVELDDPDASALLLDEHQSKTTPLARWARMTESRRKLLLSAHEARRAAFLAAKAKEAEAKGRDKKYESQAQQLEAYLVGELDPEVSLGALLQVPLLSVDTDGSAGWVRLAEARRKYAGLDSAQRAKLGEQHKQNKLDQEAEAQRLAREKKAREEGAVGAALRQENALKEAEQAASESARVVAEERARLFGVQGRFAQFEKELGRLEVRAAERREKLLAWTRRGREFRESDPFASGRDARAWALYQELVGDLSEFRKAFRSALGGLKKAPQPEEIKSLPELPEVQNVPSLRELDTALRKERAELVERSRQAHAQAAATLRDQTVALNDERLALLGELSSVQRSELAGLGPAGVAQMRREFDQMQLEARYHVLTTRAQLQATVSRHDRVVLFFAFLKLVLLVLVFRTWRARAPAWLSGVMDWGKTAAAGPLGPLTRKSAWYVQRLRPPIEWYLLLATGVAVTQSIIQLPEVAYLNEVITWICVGSLAVRWADALGADLGQSIDRTQLRFRSLRLVAVGLVAVLLLLRLAELSVGRGALFSWISRLSLAWMVVVVLRLLFWWRPQVLARVAARAEPSGFYIWAQKRKVGLASLLVTLLVGTEMIIESGYRFLLRRVTHLQAAQRFLAYLFRRELEKRSSAEEDKYEPADDSVLEALQKASENPPLVESYGSREVKRCVTAIRAEEGAIVALIAERGLGKTRFADRVCAGIASSVPGPPEGEEQPLPVRIRCARPGYNSLLKQLADALGGGGSASEEAVVELIHAKQPAVIAIDDATRLIRPFIGGLRDFDRLAHLARQAGVKTSWVLGISNAAFNYLSRAREGRAVMDLVVRLPDWSEAEIAQLTRNVAAQAGLDLKYDDLVIPNQMHGSSEKASLEQTEQDYCRMLWDFADGNPSIAMHFFARSLRKRNGEHHVRLFHQPPSEALEEHPTSVLFVLRSVLQLGIATEADVVRCTGLPGPEVADALRLARGRKYVRFEAGRYAITVEWYRMVTQILRRQHLLIE